MQKHVMFNASQTVLLCYYYGLLLKQLHRDVNYRWGLNTWALLSGNCFCTIKEGEIKLWFSRLMCVISTSVMNSQTEIIFFLKENLIKALKMYEAVKMSSMLWKSRVLWLVKRTCFILLIRLHWSFYVMTKNWVIWNFKIEGYRTGVSN